MPEPEASHLHARARNEANLLGPRPEWQLAKMIQVRVEVPRFWHGHVRYYALVTDNAY